MKNLLLIFLLGLSITATFAQGEKKIDTRKNTLAFEVYNPLQVPELHPTILNNAVNNGYHTNIRNHHSIAFGISFESMIKNGLVMRMRVGAGRRKTYDLKKAETINELSIGQERLTESNEQNQNRSFRNVFVGLSKKIQLSEKLSLDLGLDLAFIAIVNTTSDNHLIVEVENDENPEFGGSYDYQLSVENSNTNNFGIGPVLKPEYQISERIVLAMEFPIYFMYSASKGESTSNTVSEHLTFGETDPLIVAVEDVFDIDSRQWTWSQISPLVRIGFRF